MARERASARSSEKIVPLFDGGLDCRKYRGKMREVARIQERERDRKAERK